MKKLENMMISPVGMRISHESQVIKKHQQWWKNRDLSNSNGITWGYDHQNKKWL